MQASTLSYYEENANTLSVRYESANVSELQKALLQAFPKNSKLLEVGCGSGRDASFLSKLNYDILAIDGSKKMIEKAKKIHPELSEKLICKTLPCGLDFETNFDGVYSIATLMHLSKNDLMEALKKIYALLNKSGKLLMSISLARDDINEHGIDEKGRFFLILTFDEWMQICQGIGFEILEAKTNKDGLDRAGIEWLTLVARK